jgi:hypothetical protein
VEQPAWTDGRDAWQEDRVLIAVKAAIAVPTIAALTAAAIAVHTSIGVGVIAYNLFWRRRERQRVLRSAAVH